MSWRQVAPGHYSLMIDNESFDVIVDASESGALIDLPGGAIAATVKDSKARLIEKYGGSDAIQAKALRLHAPMPGLVLDVRVSPGDAVQAGQGLVVLEAMKMENELQAPGPGVVRRVHVVAGDAVVHNALLIEFE